MSQNVIDYSLNPTGSQLMDNYLAKDQENCLTTNSGIQRPSYAQAGTLWVDTSATPWVLKMYDGSNDVSIGSINLTTHEFISSNSANVVNLTDNQTIGGIKTFNGSVIVPDRISGDNTRNAANTKFVTSAISSLQPSNTAVTHTANTAAGNNTNPVYVNQNGVATRLSSTVGSTTQPVYLNSGRITACTTDTVHVVVETYVNGSSWYRIYDDGWVEQGGLSSSIGQDGNKTITLLKPFANSNYSVSLTYKTSSAIVNGEGGLSYNPSTSSFVIYNGLDGSYAVNWVACGMGA